jgi:hypothetical protein
MYIEVFGREDGYIVYREVKTLVYQRQIDEKKEKKKVQTKASKLFDGESYPFFIRSPCSLHGRAKVSNVF